MCCHKKGNKSENISLTNYKLIVRLFNYCFMTQKVLMVLSLTMHPKLYEYKKVLVTNNLYYFFSLNLYSEERITDFLKEKWKKCRN